MLRWAPEELPDQLASLFQAAVIVLILDLDPRTAGWLIIAIEDLKRRYPFGGGVVPPGVDPLVGSLRSGLCRGQGGSTLAALDEVVESAAMARKLLDYDDLAAVLHVSRSTVKRLTAEGAIPTVKVGGAVRVRATDLDTYIALLPTIDRKAS